MKKDNVQKYHQLRQEYNVFTFERFDYALNNDKINIKYTFNLSNKHVFTPELIIHLNDTDPLIPEKFFLENLIFQIGMIELVSYWKAACPPLIIIKPYKLDEKQIAFWKKIYYHGLGEFFYINGISEELNEFVSIISASEKQTKPFTLQPDHDKVIVPVGGGKDSVVTLELLKNKFSIFPFIINPRRASTETVMKAGFKEEDIVKITRIIHPLLLSLNQQGYLNGHTPFSALIGFTSLLAATLTNSKYIALSNESSANEPTVKHGPNHQYSKSFAFESDFRAYVREYISPDIEYFSFLRPLSEFLIARIFAGFPEYFPLFKSCNAGSKKDIWCGQCPKCLFTAIILSPFIDRRTLVGIFNSDVLDNRELLPEFNALAGITEVKPFECVGTIDEVNRALALAIKKYEKNLPRLLDYYRSTPQYSHYIHAGYEEKVDLDNEHFLPGAFVEYLKLGIDEG